MKNEALNPPVTFEYSQEAQCGFIGLRKVICILFDILLPEFSKTSKKLKVAANHLKERVKRNHGCQAWIKIIKR